MKYNVIHIILLAGILSILLLWNVGNPPETVEAIVVEEYDEEYQQPRHPEFSEYDDGEETDTVSLPMMKSPLVPPSALGRSEGTAQVIFITEERTFFGSLESFMTMIIGLGNLIVFYFQRKDKKQKLTS